MIRYYLYLSEKEQGPYTILQLRGMWTSGLLTLETLYRLDDDGNWYPLSMIVDALEVDRQAVKPSAGVAYVRKIDPAEKQVVVTDVEMKFGSMVKFLVKMAIASIPASIILAFIFGVLYILFALVVTGMARHD